jgi:hypothetical protein
MLYEGAVLELTGSVPRDGREQITPPPRADMLWPFRGLLLLFAINVASVLLHYADNVLRLELYPDLPTTRPWDIVLFGTVMLAAGLLGIVMYASEKKRAYSFYLLHIYNAMNLVVLGHYLPSRLPGPFLGVDPSVHLTILFEASSTLVLCAYVLLLHHRFCRRRNAVPHAAGTRQ